MDDMKWEKLTDVYGRIEADVLKSYLEAEGISVELFQESVGFSSFPTTIDSLGRVQVFVPKEQFEEAKNLFEAFQNASPDDKEIE